MLEHDHVALLRTVLHLGFEGGAEGVEEVVAGGDGLGLGEESDPPQAGEDTFLLGLGRERSLLLDRGDEGSFVGRRSSEGLGGDLGPRKTLGSLREVVDGRFVEETSVDESLDEFGESLVTKGSTNNSLGFRDLVSLSEGSRIAVGVSDKGLYSNVGSQS